MAQLIKRVKALPTGQRDRLVMEILALEMAPRPRRGVARVAWPDLEARAKRIVGDRVRPNLVLLDRGEEAY